MFSPFLLEARYPGMISCVVYLPLSLSTIPNTRPVRLGLCHAGGGWVALLSGADAMHVLELELVSREACFPGAAEPLETGGPRGQEMALDGGPSSPIALKSAKALLHKDKSALICSS